MPPKSGINLQFRACSLKSGLISDTFQLQYSIGEDRTKNTFQSLPEVKIHGNFIKPELFFEPSTVVFYYEYKKNVEIPIQKQTIAMTCSSELPTNFRLEMEKPEFALDKS